MGFLSRLFGSSSDSRKEESIFQGEESVFRIPWHSEAASGDCGLLNVYVLLSDIEGLTASDIAPIREKCKQAGRPLVLVTPGVDWSILQLLGDGDTTAIKAIPLPDQPLGGLLGDVAAITGGNVLCKPLGLGLSFPDSLASLAKNGIVIPDLTWKQLSLHDLAAVDHLRITRDGTQFHWTDLPQERKRYVQAFSAVLMREEPSPGRDERLRRLWTATALLPDKTKTETVAMLQSDFSPEYPFGLALPYFVTEASSMECQLDDALVAIFGEPLRDLDVLVRLLGLVVVRGRPLLLLAPSVSDEALAICVVNKLRGILCCAAAIPRTQTEKAGALLAEVASRTGAKILRPSIATPSQRDRPDDSLGTVKSLRATNAGLTITPGGASDD
jgi:hypothetical protein